MNALEITRTAPRKAARAPALKGSSLLGLGRFRRNPLAVLLEAWREVGDVARFEFGRVQMHFVAHPDMVQRVLQDNFKNYGKQSVGYRKLRLALGDGLLTSEGDFWRRQRRIAQPAFHKDRLRRFGAVMTASTDAMLERWDAHAADEPLDVAAEMMRLTLDIIGKTMFSTDLSDQTDRLGGYMTTAIHYLNERMMALTSVFDFPEKLPTPKNRRFKDAMRAGDVLVQELIDQRRSGNGDGGDLLSMLMETRDEETGEGMTDKQLRDEVITIFAAGHETTANALAWTWYLLSKNPDAARKLRAELDHVLGGRLPSVDDVPALSYTMGVVKEVLRLYPPAWAMSRTAIADDEIGGYGIRAGSHVLVSPYITHRHRQFWENPEGFDPDRFRNPPARYAYFPFGGGPRLCIGHNFAMMEAVLIVATIAQRYDLHLEVGHPIEMQPLITLRSKHGVRMFIAPRQRDSRAASPP